MLNVAKHKLSQNDGGLSLESDLGLLDIGGSAAEITRQVQKLIYLINKRYNSGDQLPNKNEFIKLSESFLIKDLSSFSFPDFHKSRKLQDPSLLRTADWDLISLTSEEFQGFLCRHAHEFIEYYRDRKRSGYTSCGPISEDSSQLLNSEFGKKCSSLEGIKQHAFVVVLVDEQPYIIDFTYDQFIDYERIKNKYWQHHPTEAVSYAGLFIMPVDRITFK